ncbi:MAG: hypothetical protein Q9165_005747 [Trypethelium subeluteriae]
MAEKDQTSSQDGNLSSTEKTQVEMGQDKSQPFATLDGRDSSVAAGDQVIVSSLADADEALAFLENHPRAAEIAQEGNAILEDPKRLKRLLLKIDLTIAPLLAAVYFLQYLDKTTLSYTAVMGLRTDTRLVGQDYSNLSMLFYIGFLATEFPTQYIAQRLSRLSLYLGVNIMLWGAVLACHAACHDFAGLAVCRTLLGVFESCVAPILVLIIAMWYKKAEQGRRVSWFYVCNSLTQIVGGGIAYGVSFTHSSFASWRIFFVAIGAATMVIGAMVALFLPDSPVKARRFTDAEKVAALMRVKDNQSAALMIGLDLNGKPQNRAGLLAASFLSGTFGASFMLLLAWNASNIAGHSKKVTANALTLVSFAVGNILGTQTFQNKQAPGYISGKISIIATLVALCFAILVLRVLNDRLNRKNKKKLADMGEDEKELLKEKMAFADRTDRDNPFFVYTH